MKLKKITALSAAAAMALLMPIHTAAQTYNYVTKPETAAVTNPHKGWVQYVYSPWYFESPVEGVENNPTWDIVSTVYNRFQWKDIETDDGVYDWSAIDNMISSLRRKRKNLRFRDNSCRFGFGRRKGTCSPICL